jgi:hypothetical protein
MYMTLPDLLHHVVGERLRSGVAQTLVSAAPRLISAPGPSLDTTVETARKCVRHGPECVTVIPNTSH